MKAPTTILTNIDAARKFSEGNDSVKIVAVVSGSETDKNAWQKRLSEVSRRLFNSDGSTFILSLQEKIGKKTREGNFLGTLLAYRYIKEAAVSKKIPYRDRLALIGMLFGRGERMSPITQAKGCRKPAIEVTPAKGDSLFLAKKRLSPFAFTAIEEALFYFTPVARYIEKRGFRGVLNKWGDETEVASRDLTKDPSPEEDMTGHDVIKIISTVEITDELARQKDWVVFDDKNNMIAQLSRNDKDVLIKRLKKMGIKPYDDGKYYAGISLGPVAVSYEVLDIALEIFEPEIETDGVRIDFDPYFLMALAMDEKDIAVWEKKSCRDEGIKELIKMVPDFFQKVQRIKKTFKEKHRRDLNLKTFDMGRDTYWADIGQHSAMRDKFLTLLDDGDKGVCARKIADLPLESDDEGNIIVNSELSPHVTVKNSVIVNSKVRGYGCVKNSVILDSEFKDLEATGAFAVRSVRRGKTVLKDKSGLYESLGAEDLCLDVASRGASVLTSKGKVDMKVAEGTDLRDKANTYDVPVFGNDISFLDAYNEMFGISMEELEQRRMEEVNKLNSTEEQKIKPLKFGTSGLRDKVENMTDQECYINATGFILFLKERGEISDGGEIAIAGDLRSSTPKIITAVAKAI